MQFLDIYFSKKIFKIEKNRHDYEVIISRFLDHVDLTALGHGALNTFIESDHFKTYTVFKNNVGIVKPYTAKTLEKRIDIIRSFLNVMYEEGIISEDLAESLKHTEQRRGISLKQLPHAKDLIKLNDYFEAHASLNDYFTLKDLIIFNLILHSGCSSEEIASINSDALTLSENRYYILINHPKERYVKINTDTAKLFSVLLDLKNQLAISNNAMFVNQKLKTRLTSRSIRNIILQACSDCGIDAFSAEKVKNAGVIAALTAHYPPSKLAHELGINSAYFNRRISSVITSEAEDAYADLFNRGK